MGYNTRVRVEQLLYLPYIHFVVEMHYQKSTKRPVIEVMKLHNSLSSVAKLMKLVQRTDNHKHHHTSVMKYKCQSCRTKKKNSIQLAGSNPGHHYYCHINMVTASVVTPLAAPPPHQKKRCRGQKCESLHPMHIAMKWGLAPSAPQTQHEHLCSIQLLRPSFL